MTRIANLARVAACGLVLGGMAAQAGEARASDLVFPVDETVSRFLMPITPFVFDAIVQGSRTVAEISYDTRGYDAVTNTLFVKNLHIRRDPLDVTIGRLRLDLGSVALENMSIDIRGLDLPPPVMASLLRAGHDKIEGDVLVGVKLNGSRSGYEVTMRYDLDKIGVLAGQATIDDLHVLVPMADLAYGGMYGDETVTGALVGATFAYQDKGLMQFALQVAAEQNGSTVEQLKAALIGMPSTVAMQVIASLSGGASAELKDRVFGWAKVVEAFINNEDAIRVTLAPAEPVPLQRITSAQTLDEPLILALNPTVKAGFAIPLPPAATPGSVAEVVALITGAGAPQDREAGARKLLAVAASGNVAGVRALGSGFGSGQVPALEGPELASLYGYLLVARALDENVSDATLSALTAKLPAEVILAAEREASDYFQKNGGGNAAPPEGLDADGFRALAYDYYEGRGVPRSYTKALTLALVATAAGDPFALDLRDDLTAAALDKKIAIDVVAARADAAVLWKAYRDAHPAP